jgi:hypothetical protein
MYRKRQSPLKLPLCVEYLELNHKDDNALMWH